MLSHRKFGSTWRIFYEVIILRFENLLQSAMFGSDSLGTDKKHADVVMYTIWNLWNEHCRRVLNNKEQTPAQITSLIQQDILVYERAHRK
jgi:hypothetical protein